MATSLNGIARRAGGHQQNPVGRNRSTPGTRFAARRCTGRRWHLAMRTEEKSSRTPATGGRECCGRRCSEQRGARRAISTAYYALFHRACIDLVRTAAPGGPESTDGNPSSKAWSRTPRTVLSSRRSEAFVRLKQRRHDAEYDHMTVSGTRMPARRFGRPGRRSTQSTRHTGSLPGSSLAGVHLARAPHEEGH